MHRQSYWVNFLLGMNYSYHMNYPYLPLTLYYWIHLRKILAYTLSCAAAALPAPGSCSSSASTHLGKSCPTAPRSLSLWLYTSLISVISYPHNIHGNPITSPSHSNSPTPSFFSSSLTTPNIHCQNGREIKIHSCHNITFLSHRHCTLPCTWSTRLHQPYQMEVGVP